MTDLFLEILNLSFSATWVVLAVVLARLLLKKAPRSLVCALWALVALRLIFGGIEAPFSLLPSSEIIPPESLFEQAPAIHSGVSSIDAIVNPVYSESLRPAPGASVNPLQVWLAVFANVWVLGMGVMAIWAGVSCYRVRRQVRECIPAEDGVYLCDRIASPFIFGLFRPKIYLPSDLGGASRAHVIAHERAHLARKDHWWKPLGFLLLTVNWFNPSLWLAYILLCRDIELACDEKVVHNFGAEEKKAYSAALLRCSVNARPITACPLAFGEVGVKQRVKSVLNYKKPAFWIILAAVVLTAVLALGLLTNPESPDPEIRWDSVLYVQDGRALKALPAEVEEVGTLRSALHDQTAHPDENGQSVHLDWEYAGQPIYLADGMLYIEEPGGKGWLPFAQKHSIEDVRNLLDHTVQSNLSLRGSGVSISEFVRDFGSREDKLRLRDVLASDSLQMQPTLDWDWSMLAVNYVDDISVVIQPRDFGEHCVLVRRESDWLMLYRDEDWAVSAWTFQCPALDSILSPWQRELAYATELFAPFATDENPVFLDYHDMTMLDFGLRIGIPKTSFGTDATDTWWDWQGHASYNDRTVSMMCRPWDQGTWMRIRYSESEDALYAGHLQSEPLTLASGATGTLYHAGDPAKWELITLDTTRGQLLVELDTTHGPSDWTEADHRMALAILGTLTLTENGNSLLGEAPPSAAQLVGVTLRAEDVTSAGLRLIYSHHDESEDWSRIVTSPQWFLEKWENDAWVNIMPEDTAWDAVLYEMPVNGTTAEIIEFEGVFGDLEAGHYRIGKRFYAYRADDIQSPNHDSEERCWAEFDVNPLGITLSVENITPSGATLVCNQDGTLWTSIMTGSPWHLERYEYGSWVSVMPESTVWTTIAYSVPLGQVTHWNINWSLIVGTLEPGRYRVSKTFRGERRPMFTLGLETVEVQQTVYAEFMIE